MVIDGCNEMSKLMPKDTLFIQKHIRCRLGAGSSNLASQKDGLRFREVGDVVEHSLGIRMGSRSLPSIGRLPRQPRLDLVGSISWEREDLPAGEAEGLPGPCCRQYAILNGP